MTGEAGDHGVLIAAEAGNEGVQRREVVSIHPSPSTRATRRGLGCQSERSRHTLRPRVGRRLPGRGRKRYSTDVYAEASFLEPPALAEG